MTLSSLLWATYGVLIKEPNVWMTNSVGLAFGLYYFYEFVQYSPKSAPTLPGSVEMHKKAIGGFFVATMLLFFSNSPLSVHIIGKAAVVLCLAMFGSPLAAVKVVIQTRSAKAIPLPFTLASVLCCFCWTVFGLFKMNDANVYVTNALGLLFGVIQAALKVIYGDNDKKPVALPT